MTEPSKSDKPKGVATWRRQGGVESRDCTHLSPRTAPQPRHLAASPDHKASPNTPAHSELHHRRSTVHIPPRIRSTQGHKPSQANHGPPLTPQRDEPHARHASCPPRAALSPHRRPRRAGAAAPLGSLRLHQPGARRLACLAQARIASTSPMSALCTLVSPVIEPVLTVVRAYSEWSRLDCTMICMRARVQDCGHPVV